MKKRSGPALISMMIAALLVPVESVQADGTFLLKRCKAAVAFSEKPERFRQRAEMAYCYGLLQGIRETNRLYERKFPAEAYFCLGDKYLGHRESAKLVVDYLNQHPEKLHQSESLLAIQALRQAYPCSKQAAKAS